MTEYTPITQEQENTLVKKANNVLDLVLKLKEVIFIMATLVMVFLSVFYAYKSTPLLQADRDADFRITAVESDVSSIRDDIKVIIQDVSSIKSDTQFIKGKLSQ